MAAIMVELKKIHKSYSRNQQSFQVLDQVDLSVRRGEILGVLGRSGAGKSTLLRCINLLERPASGEVLVNGIHLTSLSANQLRIQRRKIGMIFQHFNLLDSRTAFQNIALPLELMGIGKKEIERKVSSLLEWVELSDRRDHFPEQLSGGQKQRVAIARALASDPQVLLSDEATSALDEDSTKSILNLLARIRKELGLTIILVTHQKEVARKLCDRVGFLEEGKWTREGTAKEILKQADIKSAFQEAEEIGYE